MYRICPVDIPIHNISLQIIIMTGIYPKYLLFYLANIILKVHKNYKFIKLKIKKLKKYIISQNKKL